MAKATPDLKLFTGTYGNVVIYVMRGQLCMRSKSSLTAKRVKKDPAFRNTMAYASMFGRASRIGSQAYKIVSRHKKQRALYQAITGDAMRMIKNSGRPELEIKNLLIEEYQKSKIEARIPIAIGTKMGARGQKQALDIAEKSKIETRIPIAIGTKMGVRSWKLALDIISSKIENLKTEKKH